MKIAIVTDLFRYLLAGVTRPASDEVTEAMNWVVDGLGTTEPDPFVTRATRHIFERTEW